MVLLFADTVDDRNPALPSVHYTVIHPRVLVYKAMQHFYHEKLCCKSSESWQYLSLATASVARAIAPKLEGWRVGARFHMVVSINWGSVVRVLVIRAQLFGGFY